MAEQWMSASQGLEIAGDRFAPCTRLNEGMIPARTKLLILGDRLGNSVFVPKEFGGQGAMEPLTKMGVRAISRLA
jgi:hypothetical protein